MSSPEIQRLLEQGIRAVREGNKEEAQAYLMRVVEKDEQNAEAWLWLASAVETDEEKITCLENVLVIDPYNEKAERSLAEIRRGASNTGGAAMPFDTSELGFDPNEIDFDPFAADKAAAQASPQDMFGFKSDFEVGDDSADNFSADGPFNATTFSEPAPPVAPPSMPSRQSAPSASQPTLDETSKDDVLGTRSRQQLTKPSSPPPPIDQDDEDDEQDSPVYEGGYDSMDSYGYDDELDDPQGDDAIDPFALIPDWVKPTRSPGMDEVVSPMWRVGVVVLGILNVGAVALLVFQIL